MAAQFAASPEAYFIINGSNADNWLTYAYRTILNRTPDTNGFNAWSQVLQAGMH